jgi:hypothetical protein
MHLALKEFSVKMTLIRALTVVGLLAMSTAAHASPGFAFWMDWF